MARQPRGAAQITHNLKEFGHGSMKKGLERLANESRQAGRQDMINYFQRLSLLERVFGPSKMKK